ncbi:hypothetical protein GYMLUDRAFT_977208 [Collybiopsis luxurians FD-317 M1]|nr:hypothetical protein GYMLUDRAFT_977208 [Collybiopsis luxurians FD-317 M1]
MALNIAILRALVSALVVSGLFVTVWGDEFLQQNFAVPVLTTTQCDTLNIQWSRASTNTGPDPVAPYYLSIYTSAYVFPFVVAAGSGLSFDFTVPFGPGTSYQICMFDSRGNTGGCQAIYTVIPSTNSSSLSCSNSTVTFPLGPLDVDAEVATGALSQYGWPAQCSDITVTPKNGTGPYTFTVAPTLHPPVNITSSSASAMTWTIDLTWASPFFISVSDSAGSSWAYGPLHVGEGSDSCLGSGSKGVPAGAVAGAGVGGVLVGLLVGSVAAFYFLRRRRSKRPYLGLDVTSPRGSPSMTPYDQLYRSQIGGQLLDRSPSEGTAYHVEPFIMPDSSAGPRSPTSERPGSLHDPSQSRSVYVVHHDGGRAPITVYHDDGTEVVELPPRYLDGAPSAAATGGGTSRSRSDTRSEAALSNSDSQASGDASSRPPTSDGQPPTFLQPQRKVQATPRKSARNQSSSLS